MFFCFLGMIYLPDLKGSQLYSKYIVAQADSLGPNLLGLPVPPLESDHLQNNENGESQAVLPRPRGRYDDELRLKAKIQEHFNLSQEAVIPKPNLIPPIKLAESSSASAQISMPSLNVSQLPEGDDPDPEVRKKRDFVKNMMIISWDNYKKYAWGDNELKPISKRGHSAGIFGTSKLGATIVDGLDTLWIMGLKDRFKDGRDWIEGHLTLDDITTEMSVFETIIRFVGGLLTCYAFTKDEMFLRRSVEIADKMLPAFDTPTGLPHSLIKPASGASKNYAWASQSNSILAEVGTLYLEFAYLTAVTGDKKYLEKVERIRELLDSIEKPFDGLYPNYINPKTGKFGQQHISVGALGDSFYEYLLKTWLFSDKTDVVALRMYNEAIDAIDKHLVQKSQSGLVYLADMRYGRLEHKMGHLACFSAGMFGLGAKTNAHDEKRAEKYLKLGGDLAHTCHESYARTATKIGPEVFWFTGDLDAQIGRRNERYYILRPEVIEGWFYMWRLTKDPKYRQWAWDAVEAIQKHCFVPGGTGYSGISNVDSNETTLDDVQQSFWLAETLKYLYLIFSNDDLVSLDTWVFNTEAHPLPIRNRNPAFPPNAITKV